MDIASIGSDLAASAVSSSIDISLMATINNLSAAISQELFASIGIGQNISTTA